MPFLTEATAAAHDTAASHAVLTAMRVTPMCALCVTVYIVVLCRSAATIMRAVASAVFHCSLLS
jgi:hypothetical protein